MWFGLEVETMGNLSFSLCLSLFFFSLSPLFLHFLYVVGTQNERGP